MTETWASADPLRGTAFHEAGYAVAYLALSRQFERVRVISAGKGEVIPGKGEYGLKDLTQGRRDGTVPISETENQIIICYAGAVAEAKLIGARVDADAMILSPALSGYPTGHAKDFNEISDLAGREPTWRKPRSHKARLLRKTQGIVLKHWAAVSRIAKALLERGELTLEECEALFHAEP